MTRYQKEGRNKHDDAPDATTGVVETMQALGGDIGWDWEIGSPA